MTDVQTTGNSSEYLVFSNLFEQSEFGISTESAFNLITDAETASASQIYKLIKNGSFAFGRQLIIATFTAAGGTTKAGQPANIKGIIKLCLEVTAQGYMSSNSANHVRIWFDPFSGRLELSTASGQRDSLTLWARTSHTV